MTEHRFHTEPVRDARHALEMLDDVDSLVLFCSVAMPDIDRYYRGAEAFWRVVHWIVDGERAAIAALRESLSYPQKRLLTRMAPAHAPAIAAAPGNGRFTYVVESRGSGLQTCSALAKRGITAEGDDHAFERGMIGHVTLTPLGIRLRDHILSGEVKP